jgi:hypothetical protein
MLAALTTASGRFGWYSKDEHGGGQPSGVASLAKLFATSPIILIILGVSFFFIVFNLLL